MFDNRVPRGALRACVLALCLAMPAVASAVDREKLLTEPGVYGTFAAFRIEADWGKLDPSTRMAHLTAL